MKKFLFLSLLTFALAGIAQAQQSTAGVLAKYSIADLQGKKMTGSQYTNYMMYATGRYQIYIEPETQKVAIKSMGKEALSWTAKEVNEYTKFEPHFFVPDFKNFPVILMLEEIIDGSSNGQHVFVMDKGKAFYCGFIGLAADKGEGASITKYMQINMKGGSMTFTFTNESDLFSWADYEVFKGKDVAFEINTRQLAKGIKPTATSKYQGTGESGSYPTPEEKLNNDTGETPQKDNYTW